MFYHKNLIIIVLSILFYFHIEFITVHLYFQKYFSHIISNPFFSLKKSQN